eukprot:8040093-Pyramimonas_sp.AAC.1
MADLHASMCELIDTLNFFRQESDSAIITDSMAERVSELLNRVKEARVTERSPPAGLGYRNTNATHKAAALAHQLFLLSGSFMQHWVRRILSFTTDFGVEAGLGKMKHRLDVLCPHAVKLEFEADNAGDGIPDGMGDDGQSGDEAINPLTFDLTPTLQVPGSLHILHNISKDVTESTTNFGRMKPGMKALANFLKEKHLREALVATCFSSPASRPFACRFRTFESKLLHWRWMSVSDFIAEIEPLERCIRRFWNTRQFLQHRASGGTRADENGEKDGESFGSKLHSFAEAVANEELWSYMGMLRLLMTTLNHLNYWVQGCPCHVSPESADGDLYWDVPDICVRCDCPLRGRRAPEMAQ